MAEGRGTLLEETIAVQPAAAAVNGRAGVVAADPLREYVAAGTGLYSPTQIRALPTWIDPLDRDFPSEIYEQMLLDPAVSASVTLLKAAVLSEDVTLTPVVDEKDPAFALARAITDMCRRALDGLSESLSDILWEMMDAPAFGNRMAELVYDRPARGPDAGRLMLTRVKVKPRRSVAFVVDSYFNVVGILGRLVTGASALSTGGLLGTTAPPPNLLPREKFAVLTWRPSDGDPRGTSVLRPAYNTWWIKTQAWPGFLKYLAQFGNPSLIGFTAESTGMARIPSYDASGNQATDDYGNPVYLTPEQAMLSALLAFQSSSAAVFPNGAAVEILEPKGPAGSGQVYRTAVDILDRQIVLSILCQTLSTTESRFGARAAAQVHQDVLGLVIRHGKRAVTEMIRRDILTPLVRYNWGEDALPLVPVPSLGSVSQEDKPTLMNAVANLQRGGYFTPGQLRLLDQTLGLPVREDEPVVVAPERPAVDEDEDPEMPNQEVA